MSIFKQFDDVVRRVFRPSTNREDYPEDLVGMASVLSLTIEPRAQFVDSLGQLLNSMEPSIPAVREPVRPGVFKWRKVAMRVVYAVIALAIVGALTIYVQNDDELKIADALVLSNAVEKLFDVRTVRYEVESRMEHGICFTGYNTPFTVEEIATIEARGEKTDGVGVVYGCTNEPWSITETGVFDLENREFYGLMSLEESGLITGEQNLTTERLYVDRTLWGREGDEWQTYATANVWVPFSFGSFGQVPAGDLKFLRSQYEEIEIVGKEEFEGIAVTHFRASRSSVTGEESVEVWIGVEDGLPHKAIVRTESEMSSEEEEEILRIKELQQDGGQIRADQRDDPIIRRGDWPEKRIITYTLHI